MIGFFFVRTGIHTQILTGRGKLAGCLILAGFMAVSFWVYRHGLAALPRADHIDFLKERVFVDSDREFFLRSLSYSRTRQVGGGDYYLFQPGKMGLLALVDILFRDNLYATGAVSILLHALTAFALFLVLSRCVRAWLAWSAALFFLVQYTGLEMIFWRHISPYMAALFFLSLGFLELLRPPEGNGRGSVLRAGGWLLLSAFFHEAIVPVLLICGLFFSVFPPRDSSGNRAGFPGGRQAMAVFILPAAIYLAANVIDYFYFKPPAFLGVDDKIPSGLTFSGALGLLARVSGASLAAWLAPFTVRFAYLPGLYGRAVWQFSVFPDRFFHLFSAGAFLFLLLAAGWAVAGGGKKRSTGGIRAVAFIASIYAVILIAGLLSLRVFLRGIYYLYFSTYYFYMTNFLFSIAGAVLADRAIAALPGSQGLKKTLTAMAVCGLAALTMYDYRAIQGVLKPRATFDDTIARTNLQAARFFREHADYCYGGALDEGPRRHIHRQLLYRYVCGTHRQIPLYALNGGDGKYSLSRLEEGTVRDVSMDPGSADFVGRAGGVYSVSPQPRMVPPPGVRMLLSREAYDPVLFEASFENLSGGGLVAGYRDAANYVLLVVDGMNFYARIMSDGKLSGPASVRGLVIDRRRVRLTLAKVKGQYHVLFNRNWGIPLEGVSGLRGRVGVFAFPDDGARQVFSEIRISEADAQPSGEGLKFVPAAFLPSGWQDPSGKYVAPFIEEQVLELTF